MLEYIVINLDYDGQIIHEKELIFYISNIPFTLAITLSVMATVCYIMLNTGDTLSDFTLEGVDENGNISTYTLSELTEDAVAVLNVYVYDYSPVCTSQVCDISELEWLSINEDVNVVGLSGDGPYAHQRFIEDNRIGYPLLCDTAEEIIEELGVIHEEKDGLRRVPQRSIFLIDEDRRIRWKWVAEDNWDDWTSGPIEALHDTISQLRT